MQFCIYFIFFTIEYKKVITNPFISYRHLSLKKLRLNKNIILIL